MTTYRIVTDVTVSCPSCNGGQVKKVGKRNGQQRFQCSCGKRFRSNGNVEGKNHDPVQIGMTILNAFAGLSLKHLAVDIKERYGIKEPSRQTIYNWIMDYSDKAAFLLEDVKADTSDHWVIDEERIFVNRKLSYIFNILDYKTRFLLATYLSDNKSRASAERVLRKAMAVAKNPPKRITTDKMPSYGPAIRRLLPDTEHILSQGVGGKVTNNRSERMQGTYRARTKTLRCLKTIETGQQFLEGFTINYNYFRGHSALGGKTPAEAAGIKAPFKNWADVVRSPVVAPKRVRQPRPDRKAHVESLPRDITERKRVQRAKHRAADAAKKKARKNQEKPSDGTVAMLSKTLKSTPAYKRAARNARTECGKSDRMHRRKVAPPRPVIPGMRPNAKVVREGLGAIQSGSPEGLYAGAISVSTQSGLMPFTLIP